MITNHLEWILPNKSLVELAQRSASANTGPPKEQEIRSLQKQQGFRSKQWNSSQIIRIAALTWWLVFPFYPDVWGHPLLLKHWEHSLSTAITSKHVGSNFGSSVTRKLEVSFLASNNNLKSFDLKFLLFAGRIQEGAAGLLLRVGEDLNTANSKANSIIIFCMLYVDSISSCVTSLK